MQQEATHTTLGELVAQPGVPTYEKINKKRCKCAILAAPVVDKT